MKTDSAATTIRHATPGDHAEIARLDGLAFGVILSEQDQHDVFDEEPPAFVVAEQQGHLAGVAGHRRYDLTVPGGSISVPGVTWVSVNPVHRRQGVLRRLMNEQLTEYAAAGELAAILTASEGGIYRRFGYGPASLRVKTLIDRRSAVLTKPVDVSDVRAVPVEVAQTLLPELHRRWCAVTPGAVSRSQAWWNTFFLDREHERGGMSARYYLVHPDGYFYFRIRLNSQATRPANGCWLGGYAPVTAAAHAALWQVLLGMDLIGDIESGDLPVDDPLPYLLTDARQVQTTSINDGVWLRPIDVAGLLAARTYQLEVGAVVEVADELPGAGRFALQAGPDGASCTATDRPADLRLSRAALGSVYLGGHRLATLARAGLVDAPDPGLLRRLDLAFGADRAPSHGTTF